MLNHSEAALRRDRRRACEVGEKGHVVVRRVEVGMVEDIERIEFEAKVEALFKGELLGHAHIEAHLKWPAEQVPSGGAVQGLETIAARRVACRYSVRTGSYKLRRKIGWIQHWLAGIDAESALQFRLLGSDARYKRHVWISYKVRGTKVQTCYRAREVIDAIRLAALRHGLPAYHPAVDHFSQSLVMREFRNRVAVIDQKNVGLIEVRRRVV